MMERKLTVVPYFSYASYLYERIRMPPFNYVRFHASTSKLKEEAGELVSFTRLIVCQTSHKIHHLISNFPFLHDILNEFH